MGKYIYFNKSVEPVKWDKIREGDLLFENVQSSKIFLNNTDKRLVFGYLVKKIWKEDIYYYMNLVSASNKDGAMNIKHNKLPCHQFNHWLSLSRDNFRFRNHRLTGIFV